MTETYGYTRTRQLLERREPPTALLVSSIIPALGVRRALVDAGLKLGTDVSVVIHDDVLSYFRNDGDVPTYTATRSSVRMAGERAADLLLRAIAEPDGKKQHVHLEAELTLGQSTGPAPAFKQLLNQD
jgi:LacI family transcriptional regulator